MSTIKISELATNAISLTDFFAKADANGLANKNTVQGLSNFLNTVGTLAYRGVLLAADAAVTLDGIYVAGDAGTYTNNGGLVITLSNQIVLISITETQTVFEKVEIPVSIVKDATPTEGSTNTVESNGVADAIGVQEFSLSTQTTRTYLSGTITTNVAIGAEVDFTVTPNELGRHGIVDCVEGDFFYLKGEGGNAPRLWAFLDVNNNLLSISSSDLVTFNAPVTITAPSNSVKAVFNTFINTYPKAYILKLDSIFKDINAEVLVEKNERISEDLLLRNNIQNTEKLFITENEVNLITSSYIRSQTEEPASNSSYKRTSAIQISLLSSSDIYVSTGNQGNSVAPVAYYSSATLTSANFISEEIETTDTTNSQVNKYKLTIPSNATHFVISSNNSFYIKLFTLATELEINNKFKSAVTPFQVTSDVYNSYVTNPYNTEANLLQRRGSTLLGESNNVSNFVTIVGQSNADGRVNSADAPTWYTSLNGYLADILVWSREEEKFLPYESGVNTGAYLFGDTRHSFDIYFYKKWMDTNPGKKLYVYKKTRGGTPIAPTGGNAGASWDPKTELVEAGREVLCTEMLSELRILINYCQTEKIQLFNLGILISQGESDGDLGSVSTVYAQRRKNWVSWLRGLFNSPTMPILSMGVRGAYSTSYEAVNTVLDDLDALDSNSLTVDMTGQSLNGDGSGVHFGATAVQFAGETMWSNLLTFTPTY